jgi:hypothetical protein
MPASGRNPVKQSGPRPSALRTHVKQIQRGMGGIKASISAGRQPVRQSPPQKQGS